MNICLYKESKWTPLTFTVLTKNNEPFFPISYFMSCKRMSCRFETTCGWIKYNRISFMGGLFSALRILYFISNTRWDLHCKFNPGTNCALLLLPFIHSLLMYWQNHLLAGRSRVLSMHYINASIQMLENEGLIIVLRLRTLICSTLVP